MQCPNCGAALTGKELRCPYCGWENPKIAEENQKSELNSIYRKTAELLHLPERIVKKICHWLLIVVGAALGVYLLILAGTGIYTAVRNNTSYAWQQKNLQKLEAYYEAGEYDKMMDYLEKLDGSYSATFGKYKTIGDLWKQADWELEYLGETVSYIKSMKNVTSNDSLERSASSAAYCITYLEKLLSEIDELEAGGFIYGEGPEALAFREEIETALRDQLRLTEEEIADARQWEETDAEMLALAEECCRRIWTEESQ